MNLKNKKLMITGASFIGYHLIKKLLKESPKSITVVNLTDKHFKIIGSISKSIKLIRCDLRDANKTLKTLKNTDIVFHLAAAHGGRGYVELNDSETSTNFLLDGSVFSAAVKNNVEKIFYASSGCVYPNYLQKDVKKNLYLKEEMVGPPYDADNMYGWAKLMGEMTLKVYYKKYGLKSAIGRFFTVYGPEASESHAVMATIAKTFIGQDPFQIWGDGKQVRNWTYVDDIVEGTMLMTKKIDDATSINLGTMERVRVIDMARKVWRLTGFTPKKIDYLNKLVGPVNRICDNRFAKKTLGWEPGFDINTGLKETVDWYFKNKDRGFLKKNLSRLLISA
jgi:nucleoside-diphosphate-sugar epimerase